MVNCNTRAHTCLTFRSRASDGPIRASANYEFSFDRFVQRYSLINIRRASDEIRACSALLD